MERFKLNLMTPTNAILLLDLAEDVVSEIRETSLFLISTYCSNKTLTDLRIQIKSQWIKLLNSPKAQDSESGALLEQFFYKTFVLPYCKVFNVDCSGGDKINSNNNLSFLQNIAKKMEESFFSFQSSFMNGALNNPLHGWLLALSLCLDALLKYITTTQTNFLIIDFCFETEATVTRIVHFLLKNIFSCFTNTDLKDQKYVASADFEEMSRRVFEIIGKTEENQLNNIFLSYKFETVLSASWLSLKNSCDCLSSLGCLILSMNSVNQENTVCWLKHLCHNFVTVLSMCRHRGVLEGCHSAFIKYLTKLFNSKFYQIPIDLFWSHLKGQGCNQVELIEGGTITRRSAGIPLIIDAILTAYFSSACFVDNNLLTCCINTLLDSLKFLGEIDEKLICAGADLPQVDALYILKSILQNNQLASHVAIHLTPVLISAIDCLDSSLWVVRNAATHLSGMFAARMIGQKHIENDLTTSLSASEFFARFPELLTYFNEFFKSGLYMQNYSSKQVSSVANNFLKPSVYLIISLLSKLDYNCSNFKSDQQFQVLFVSVAAQELLSCNFYSVRTTAVKLLLASTCAKNVLELIMKFLSSLSYSFSNPASIYKFYIFCITIFIRM